MKTYFIRHSSKLDIDSSTMNKLWKYNKVGIHFPHNNKGKLEKYDSKSINPEDYKGNAKSKMKILTNLAQSGGYVYSVYRNINEIKVGFVPQHSKVKILKGKWGTKNGYNNREAILKVISLTKVKNLSKVESISLNSVQPRQGTLCVWSKVGSRVKNLVNNSTAVKKLIDLSPDQQEVMCMEFLRLNIAEINGLPRIATTLTPIGRTMKDVDIYALSTKSEKIICQVSFINFNKSSLKFNKLLPYAKGKTKTIYFCNISNKTIINNVIVFPLSKVFYLFCKKTQVGKIWLKKLV